MTRSSIILIVSSPLGFNAEGPKILAPNPPSVPRTTPVAGGDLADLYKMTAFQRYGGDDNKNGLTK